MGDDKANKAYEVLRDSTSQKNRYKFALVCIKLNRFQDAEEALTGASLLNYRNVRTDQNHLNLKENKLIPNGASGYYLLGFVLEKQFKMKLAVECYECALKMQPTLWCAFERLCKLQGGPKASKGRVDAVKIFSDKNEDVQQMNRMIREHMSNIQQHAAFMSQLASNQKPFPHV